jgi:squalene-associated FAD-dependent desaturase
MPLKTAVIGGGISGIRAALTLARAGVDTTLIEKNKHLGGRVFSFPTPDFGEVDIGQHIWLKCCTALEELLHDLNIPDDWVYRQDRLSMTYRWPDGSSQSLAAGRLPGRLSMVPIIIRARLGVVDKLKYVWGMTRAGLYSKKTLEAMDGICFADWLAAQRQPPNVVQWLWEPLVMGVCNGRLSEVSARHGLFTVRESLLKSGTAAAICLLRRPLSAVFDRHARETLQHAGVDVQTGSAVREVQVGAPVRIRNCNGDTTEYDKVVLAVPLKHMRELLPNTGLPAPPREGAIAGLLLRFAGPVMDELFFSAVGSPVQIVFNKSAIWARNAEDGSQVIELVISAAEREVKLGAERMTAELLPELAKLLPRVRHTPLLAKRLLVHATATFQVKPGGEAQRLQATCPGLTNVVLAGDYAATGWPSTMESAARAGQLAAKVLLQQTERAIWSPDRDSLVGRPQESGLTGGSSR